MKRARNSHTVWLLAALALALAALGTTLAVVLVGTASTGTVVAGPGADPTASGTGSGTGSGPGTFNVVAFGADPTGAHDATAAIGSALAAASQHPDSTVYFPPGRFLLDHPTGRLFTFVLAAPVHVRGAGVGRTTLINQVGRRTPGVTVSATTFEIVSGPRAMPGGGDGSTISDMTLDSATYDAGTAIVDYANRTTLSNLRVLAARSSNTYNPTAFGVRVIAVCNPSTFALKHRTGNVVQNVTIAGHGADGDTELDFSCQHDLTARRITITGNGVDVFYCNGVQITGATLTGGNGGAAAATRAAFTWVVTGSTDVTFTDVTAHGSGGVIEPDTVRVTTHVVVDHETASPWGALRIGDSRHTVITDSALGTVRLDPRQAVDGVAVVASTVGPISCRKGTSITGLQGIRCPP